MGKAIIFLVLSSLLVLVSCAPPMVGDVHRHADFRVVINGQAFNFSQERYMSEENETLSPFVHLHDMDGEVIHQHIEGVTLGEFFDSLGMIFNRSCFILDNGTAYCGTQEKPLLMLVNGQENRQYDRYEFNDLDRILIAVGEYDQSLINLQLTKVTDKACIQSQKCPWRGNATDADTCVGDCSVGGMNGTAIQTTE